jgi:phospholipase/carboxylesterase
MSVSPLSGPSLVPAQPTHALLCLHGFGSDGHDLIHLAPPLKQALGKLGETLAVFSPNGPAATPSNFGYQWFRDMGWTFRDPTGMAAIATQINTTLHHITRAHGVPPANIAILGFSQGGMAGLYALPELSPQPAALIACSSALTVEPPSTPTSPATPILFLHGAEDDVLPADASVKAESFFKTKGYPTQLEILPGLAHGISPAALAHIAVFLQNIWQPAE